MTHVSRAEFDRILRQAAGRKAKRDAKRPSLPWGQRPPADRTAKAKSIGTYRPDRQSIKDNIVTLLGHLDRELHGVLCRIHGGHQGELAYHIVPQQRGDAARFVPENVVWACGQANYGEKWNRSAYRDIHVKIFGRELVERLEAVARTAKKYTTAELLDLRRAVRSQIAAARGARFRRQTTEGA